MMLVTSAVPDRTGKDAPEPFYRMQCTRLLDHNVTALEARMLAPERVLESAVRRQDDVYLLELFSRDFARAVVEEGGEAFCVRFDLVLPLHESDDGCDDEGWLATGFRQKERDRLDAVSLVSRREA